MPQLSIEQMRQLIAKLDQTRSLDEEIPRSYVDRLERATQLLNELKSLQSVDWDRLSTQDDLERAEALIQQKLELKNEIEKHLNTCAMTV
jgi:hypothetical protein